MKRLLIGDCREKLLSTLEVILKHWGYRVLVTSRRERLRALIAESPPDLLIVGTLLLSGEANPLVAEVGRQVVERGCSLIILRDQEPMVPLAVAHDTLEVPLDLFALFALIQRHVEKIPRQNLRLTVKLPGMLCRGESSQLSEVLSLSRQGLFIRTGFRLEKGEKLKVLFPLLGMRRELEVETEVLYRVHPDPENNYLQGVGVAFTTMSEEAREALDAFIQKRFLGELYAREPDLSDLTDDQLQSRNDVRLRLI
ncbi:MAG: PilZ domain-containing protein [Desulfuromonadales bacterium]|nr:PilZ domain-containing protein [Desulfuromonadales bacterium]